ncbi:hypothetical protein GCM10022295_91900 [Streptomyces osmaniensis]|uniref:Transposase IS701-like DDE domain-containing protein n=2 Tax=Streptomyces osmaniensis TaxID=593134 RepID=A0ABP6Z313_9ACTN|nr:transposase [Streptomyces sp. JCM17656]
MNRERRREAGATDEVGFATKPELGHQMVEPALPAWVAANADYGKDPKLRTFCHHNPLPYTLAVPGHPAPVRPARQTSPPEGEVRGRSAALRHQPRPVGAPQPG